MIGSTLTHISQRRRKQTPDADIYILYFKAHYAVKHNLPDAQELKEQFSAHKYRFGELWRYLETAEYLYSNTQHTEEEELAA